MSADNWDVCPRCLDQAKKARLNIGAPIKPGYTFREDYETGLLTNADGTVDFYCDYKGGCTRCGLSHEHHDRVQIYKPGDNS